MPVQPDKMGSADNELLPFVTVPTIRGSNWISFIIIIIIIRRFLSPSFFFFLSSLFPSLQYVRLRRFENVENVDNLI